MAQSDWTDIRVALLRKLWAEGLSARAIADELYTLTQWNCSRNTVIGKATRIGLTGRPRSGGNGGRKPAQHFDSLASPMPANFLGLPLEQLGEGQCRYPLGQGPYLFCGQPIQENSSYCPDCHKICWYRPERHKPRSIFTPQRVA